MNSREIFKIIVATFGLVGVIYGFLCVVDGLLIAFSLFDSTTFTAKIYLVKGIILTIVGILILKTISSIANFAFPQDEKNKDNETK